MKSNKGFTMLSQAEIRYVMDIISELAAIADPSEFLEEEVQQAIDLLENAETMGLDNYLNFNKERETMNDTTVETSGMSEEEVMAFADKICATIDADGIISPEGKAMLEDKTNLPSEEDQIRIMKIVTERVQNGEQSGTTTDQEGSEGTEEAATAEEASSEAEDTPTCESPSEA
jgi:hypothetical protein